MTQSHVSKPDVRNSNTRCARSRACAIRDCLLRVDLANCETYECLVRSNLRSGFNYGICGNLRVVSFLLGVERDRGVSELNPQSN